MIALTDAQKKTIHQWVDEGCSLTEIQKRLNEEFKLTLTFMDARFLMLDLEIKLKDKPSAISAGMDLSKTPPAKETAGLEDENTNLPPGSLGGSVAVDIDRIMKPGTLVSGSVRFSDGVSASWSLDQSGRLALMASKPGYRPSQEDVQAFQQELSALLQKHGF